MGRSKNIALGALATALITFGIAAQTGTVKWPGVIGVPGPSGAVQAQEATASPVSDLSPSPSPPPTQAAAPAPPAPAPPAHKKHGH